MKTLLKSKWFWSGLLLLTVLAGATVWWFYGHSANETGGRDGSNSGPGSRGRGAAVSVVVTAARSGVIADVQSALGTITPRNVVTVHSRVDGELVKVLFKEGQDVKAGQLLAEIDPRSFEASLKQVQGALDRDRALLRNAELDLQRYRSLLAQDSIAQQQLDTQEALVKQYQGTVLADQGQVDLAKLQLEFTRIVAPISGRIGLRQVDPGNVIHASDANGLFVITQIRPTTVVFTVAQDLLPAFSERLRSGDKVTVQAWDRDNKVKLDEGRLDSIDNQVDLTTGTVKLKAVFENPAGTLFPNQFVNVRTLLKELKGVTLIPTVSVQRGTPGTFVYRLNEDMTVLVTPVKLGATNEGWVQVVTGLQPGDKVVVDGVDKLRDGAKVDVGDGHLAPSADGRDKRDGSRRKQLAVP